MGQYISRSIDETSHEVIREKNIRILDIHRNRHVCGLSENTEISLDTPLAVLRELEFGVDLEVTRQCYKLVYRINDEFPDVDIDIDTQTDLVALKHLYDAHKNAYESVRSTLMVQILELSTCGYIYDIDIHNVSNTILQSTLDNLNNQKRIADTLDTIIAGVSCVSQGLMIMFDGQQNERVRVFVADELYHGSLHTTLKSLCSTTIHANWTEFMAPILVYMTRLIALIKLESQRPDDVMREHKGSESEAEAELIKIKSQILEAFDVETREDVELDSEVFPDAVTDPDYASDAEPEPKPESDAKCICEIDTKP
jgi:hypothetical protein